MNKHRLNSMKTKDIYDKIKALIENKFTGSIEIHFTQGGIAKIVKHETIK